jgi:hypothetical protein
MKNHDLNSAPGLIDAFFDYKHEINELLKELNKNNTDEILESDCDHYQVLMSKMGSYAMISQFALQRLKDMLSTKD